jgi:hypothetical protein
MRSLAVRSLAGMAITILGFTWTTSAFAWWDMGHMQIAAIAYERLGPSTRSKIDQLIKLHPDYPQWVSDIPEDRRAQVAFVRAATWADEIVRDPSYRRDTVNDSTAARNIGYADHIQHDYWHYIDIPFSTDGTPVKAPPNPNALTQIRALAATLASDADADLRSYDLVWLLHLVGDVHQPLHATARFSKPLDDDAGGNDETVRTVSGQELRLHLYWDGRLGERGTPFEAIAAARGLPAADPDAGAVSDPALWLIESFAIAQNDVYTPLIGQGAGPFQLDNAYEERAAFIARERAALAGVRLANLLNEALR